MTSMFSVRSAIQEAFQGSERPPNDTLVPCNCPECSELVNALADKEWQSLAKETIRDHYNHLCLLSNAAFKYYLPAYLLCAVGNEMPIDYDVSFNTVLSLGGILMDFPSNEEQIKLLAAGFGTSQVNAVKMFLEFCVLESGDDDLAEVAYEALIKVWLPLHEGLHSS